MRIGYFLGRPQASAYQTACLPLAGKFFKKMFQICLLLVASILWLSNSELKWTQRGVQMEIAGKNCIQALIVLIFLCQGHRCFHDKHWWLQFLVLALVLDSSSHTGHSPFTLLIEYSCFSNRWVPTWRQYLEWGYKETWRWIAKALPSKMVSPDARRCWSWPVSGSPRSIG